jgi:hypothetical protein
MTTPQQFFRLSGTDFIRPSKKHGDPVIYEGGVGEERGLTALGTFLFGRAEWVFNTLMLAGKGSKITPTIYLEPLFVIVRKVEGVEVLDRIYNVAYHQPGKGVSHLLIVVRERGDAENGKSPYELVGASRVLGRKELGQMFDMRPPKGEDSLGMLGIAMEIEEVKGPEGQSGQTRFWPIWMDTVVV